MKAKSQTYISPFNEYCNGYSSEGEISKGYILGITLGIGISDSNLSHKGSIVLDEINSFDLAEVDGPYIGQLNMSIVSSFCGPQGLIWGYDLASNQEKKRPYEELGLIEAENNGIKIPIFNGDFLVEALEELFGNVNEKRYHIIPGSHVPFASKNIKVRQPSTVYSAIGIGIPKNRERNACLLMEDVGMLTEEDKSLDKKHIIENLGKSIIEIGLNQKVEYTEAIVVIRSKDVGPGQTGCALVSAPYFTIARNAIPKNLLGKRSFENLRDIDLKTWKDKIREK